ncbi:MAG: hypothetical protein ACK4P4_18010 [Allorhizobium sp.]
MSFQFVHLETYSRKGDASGRSTGFVLAEARRDPGASVHVAHSAPPIVVHGMDIDAVERRHDAAADAARTIPKGGKPRKIRVDQHTLLTVVASHPFTVEEVRADAAKRRYVEKWERLTVDWLKQQYGDALASVVRHEDESHWHIHVYVLPSSSDMKASVLHPGQTAKAEIMAAGPAPGEDSKALNRRGDAAYRRAMRDWQNSYFEAVAVKCGLTRIGPARRRLTRAEWQAETTQAKALRETLDRAEAVRQRVESFVKHTKDGAETFISRTKETADKIEAEAIAAKMEAEHRTEAAKAATAAALAAQDKAVREQRKAQGMMARARQEAARVQKAAARLQRLPSILRTLWDGFRKSQIQDRIHASVESEMNNLRSLASAEAERASKANEALRRAEEKARALDRALAEIGVQRDDARRELARVRPSEPEIGFPVVPRPQPSGRRK